MTTLFNALATTLNALSSAVQWCRKRRLRK